MLDRLAGLTWRHPRRVLLAVALVAVIAGVYAHDVEHHLKAAGFTDAASESERGTAATRDALGYDANPGLVVLVRARDGGPLQIGDAAVRREVDRLAGELAKVGDVGKVDNPLRDEAARGLLAGDGLSLILAGHLTSQDVEDEGGAAAEEARQRLTSPTLAVGMTGFAAGFNDVNDQTRKDLTNAELIAFPALTILLLLAFRGVIAAALPLLIGVLSILGTFLVLKLLAGVVDLSLFALNISTALSLGLAVDYALLIVSRFREEIDRDGPTFEAHRRTVQTAGRTVLFSGFTVAAAMAALMLMPQRFLYSLGIAGAAVGVLSAVVAVLVLPALLALLGTRVNALSIRRGPAISDESGAWYRVARAVMARPVLAGVASSALMLALAAPLAGVTLTGPSAEAVPPGQPSYDAGEYVAAHYPRNVLEPAVVAFPGGAAQAKLDDFVADAQATDGVSVAGVLERRSDFAVISVGFEEPALSRGSQDALRAIRARAGPEVLISGNTARFIDQKQSLRDHAPAVIALIAAGTLLLLFALTGSVLLPLKTLLMNTLTLAATLGILVLGFQHGLLDGLLGTTGPDAIEVTSLVFLFVVTFALATDYAVLVMARIKEIHDSGASNRDAVATGIGRTGRIISAAATMIAVVFLAFAVSPVFFMKQIAIGMALGVLLDATIVRALLVPALMRLLGERNWWAPRPLLALHRRIGLREETGSPDAAVSSPRPI